MERESCWLTPIPTTKMIVLGVIELHSMRKVPVGCYFTFKLPEKVDMTLGSFWVCVFFFLLFFLFKGINEFI
jgi:hypothetical protein